MEAIAQANKILDWYENVPSDEIPPEWMWPFNEEINEWFDEKKMERDIQHNNPTDEVASMTKNEDPRLVRLRALKGG